LNLGEGTHEGSREKGALGLSYPIESRVMKTAEGQQSKVKDLVKGQKGHGESGSGEEDQEKKSRRRSSESEVSASRSKINPPQR